SISASAETPPAMARASSARMAWEVRSMASVARLDPRCDGLRQLLPVLGRVDAPRLAAVGEKAELAQHRGVAVAAQHEERAGAHAAVVLPGGGQHRSEERRV